MSRRGSLRSLLSRRGGASTIDGPVTSASVVSFQLFNDETIVVHVDDENADYIHRFLADDYEQSCTATADNPRQFAHR
jgi:hypothetical protein